MINFSKNLLDEIKELVINSKSIYLASHINPDGDNLGSLLALAMGLRSLNKNINIIKVDNTPKDYLFLPEIDNLSEYTVDTVGDLFIALDCGDIDRLGYAKEIALNSKYIINIDHHRTNTEFGNINIVEPNISSTGEIVYELLEGLGIELTKDMATSLYTALSTDTGSFIYSNTTGRTYEIAGKLLDKGIDLNNIVVNLYQSKSLSGTKLYIEAINTMKFYFDNKVSLTYVTKDMIERNNASWDDTEGLVNFGRDIEGVELSCLLKEYGEDEIKVSLRSKEYLDVSNIAKNFNGGGHIRAAGLTINDNLENAVERLLAEIEKALR